MSTDFTVTEHLSFTVPVSSDTVMTAVPARSPLIRPPRTSATLVLLLDHLSVRSEGVFETPTDTDEPTSTVTDDFIKLMELAGFTVTTHSAFITPEESVAVIVALPEPTDLTSPVLETVATELSEDVYSKDPPSGIVLPESCRLSPGSSFAEVSLRTM